MGICSHCAEETVAARRASSVAARRASSAAAYTAAVVGAELRPMWINMHTGERSAEFPRLTGASDGVHNDIYRRTNGWSEKQRAVKAFYDVTTLRQAIGDPATLPTSQQLKQRSPA